MALHVINFSSPTVSFLGDEEAWSLVISWKQEKKKGKNTQGDRGHELRPQKLSHYIKMELEEPS